MADLDPLVVLPGLACDERVFVPVLSYLAQRPDTTIADLTRDPTIEAMATRVLATAPPRFALAGFSMGGYVALEIVRQAADRVTRLAMIASHPRPDDDAARSRRKQALDDISAGRFDAVVEQLTRTLLSEASRRSDALVEASNTMMRAVGPDVFERQTRAMMMRADARPVLEHIDGPMIAIAGQEDVVAPLEVQREMIHEVRGGQLRVIADVGHLLPFEAPQEVADHLAAWLAR